ncbi:MAG: LGFP repeat-containing protein, partial [Alsobacter sp.]
EALSARLNDHEARESAEAVLALIRPFAGRTVREIKADLLNGVGRPVEMEFQGFSSTVLAALQQSHLLRQIATETVDQALAGRGIAVAMELIKARRAIQAKAAELGWVGDRLGDVEAVPGGFRQRYAGADILVGPDGRAFEVHGEIRAKYNALGGPASVLGLPVTDETGTPDGIGRYNHFAKDGSIYWTPRTGPMMVRGRVRQEWQSQGWERGPMGYPIRDQQALTGVTPAAKPNLGWCLFENGAIMSMAGAGATAVAAEIQPEQLRGLVRRFFDQRLKAERSELGLEAAVETLSVTPWTYGFWSAAPRAITFGLHGFHDNGLLPDTTFDLQIRLRFSTAWPQSFFYPGSMTLVAALDWLRIRTSGLGSGTLANALRDGIWNAFHRGGPDPDHPEVPDGAVFLTSFSTGANQTGNGSLDVIDVLTTSAGGLQVLLNPLPPLAGGFRKAIAQNQVDAFLET